MADEPAVRNSVKDSDGNIVLAGAVFGGVHFHPVPKWLWVAVAATLSLVVVVVLWAVWPQRPESVATTPTRNPGAEPVPVLPDTRTTPKLTSSTIEEPTTTTTVAPTIITTTTSLRFRVFWTGNLRLGGYGGTGGGYWLDQYPPGEAVTGDLYYGDVNEVAGRALVPWDAATAPTEQRCAELLNTQVGRRWVTATVGSTACFRTGRGRVGYFTVTRTSPPEDLQPSTNVDATVWDLP
jgi:hypothetical protein